MFPSFFCQSIGELRGGGRLTVSKNNYKKRKCKGRNLTSSSSIPTDSKREQRCSCLSKLLIISNESPVLNSFSPFSLLPPFLFLILFFLSAFSSFFFIPFVVPIESNFTVQQDRYVRPSNQQYSDFLKYLSFPMSSGSA